MPALGDYERELTDVLRAAKGSFITAQQAFRLLEALHPTAARGLLEAYSMQEGGLEMGRGGYLSPASYISHAYGYLAANGNAHIVREEFDPVCTELGNAEGGCSGKIAIWAWRA